MWVWSMSIGILARVPAHLTAKNQLLANNRAARCRTCSATKTPKADKTGCLSGDGSSSQNPRLRQPALWQHCCHHRPLGWDNLQDTKADGWRQSLLGIPPNLMAAWMNSPLVELRAEEMRRGARKSFWSLQSDPDTCRPARHQSCVTTETVRKLCDEGSVTQAVEALGVLVQTGCCVSKSLVFIVLKKCAVTKDLVLGRRIHAITVRMGHQSDTFLCNHILRTYASHGSLQEAMDVFTMVDQPDVFMWSSIISAHVKHGSDKQAMQLYHRMRRSTVKLDGHVFVAALQACARGSDLEGGLQVHADVLDSGVKPDLFVCSGLVDMYAKCGSLEKAQSVFNGLLEKDVVTWNALIAGYSQQGLGQEALHFYRIMQHEGLVAPNSVTFVCLLQACAALGNTALNTGKQLHAHTREHGHHNDVCVANSLVNMYVKCGSLEDAQIVFDGLCQKDVVTWTALIVGYSQQGMGQQAFHLYRIMQEQRMAVPDSVTFACLLQACASMGMPALGEGKHLHAQILERGYQTDVRIANSLVNMYAKCGSLEEAQTVFHSLGRKDVVTWNAMIAGCSQQGLGQEALRLYSAMLQDCIAVPDCVTLVCLLQACATIGNLAYETGKQLHSQIKGGGYENEVFIASSLVNMYAKCGSLEDAQRVFDDLPRKDVVTWTSLIAGYSQGGMGQKALQLYDEMQEEGMAVPNTLTFVCLLQACACVGNAALDKGRQLHTQIREQGHHEEMVVASSLVNMYAKCDSLEDAQRVFDGLDQKDVVTWTALIAGYAQQGMGQKALHIYSVMQGEGMAIPNSITLVCLLQACASVGAPALDMGKELHAQVREQGLECDLRVASSLVDMYAKCSSLENAQSVFDGISEKDVVTWNIMIRGYSQEGMGEEALHLYSMMKEEGIALPDSITWVSLLQACASIGTPALEKGRQLHVQISERGEQGNAFVANSLVNMYAKCGSLEDARSVFHGIDEKNVVTWNAMIAGYSLQGMGQEALHLYSVMQEEGISVANSMTFVSLLQACASIGAPALEVGRQLHARIGELGHQLDVILSCSLVNMYAKCGSLGDAERVFEGLDQNDSAMWNAMIAGYIQKGMGKEALGLCTAMQEGRVIPDLVTFSCFLQACAIVGPSALDKGRQLHIQIREQGHDKDPFIASSLVNMYVKCGSLEDARQVFDSHGNKDAVMWTAMISGYSQQGMGQVALRLHSAMEESGLTVADSVTFVCLLQACANVAAIHMGRRLHARLAEQGLEADLFIAGSLINMYAKSGCMVYAQQVFDGLARRDVVAWSALIAGYACIGDSEMVFRLVQRMRQDGIEPVGITSVSVLTACSHAGLVDEGKEYFEVMSTHDGITPTVEHYTCMVDMLGRAGRLDEALGLVKTMPVQPNAAVWHTLLGSCQKWSNVEMGCHAFREAVKLDTKDAAAYVLMSNIYTSGQMWEQAKEMQVRRVRMGAWKVPGESWWTDMDGVVHTFLVGNKMSL